MRLSSLRRVGMDEQRRTATPGEVEIVGPREMTLSLQWFGDRAMAGLTDLAQALQKPTVVDRCMAAGFAVFDVDAVQEMGALSGTTWEERAALDLYVRIMLSTIDTPGYIHDVTIAAEYLPPADPAPVEIPSTIEQVKVNSKFV
ncbi:phage neck terminator protein [Anaeroarcus burkinensis]|uniref:phage neck terminator protein n=1 Tax=Anaeroarcus burkinensis TaxID=82376 RepID=UPI000412A566